MKTDVTAVIPTIPPRLTTLLPNALASVTRQTHTVHHVSLAVDVEHDGAWITRGRALDGANTTWTAFLDDDDIWDVDHVEKLLQHAIDTDSDYVFSWFRLGGLCGNTDRIGHFGKPFDATAPHHTTMTVLVRTDLAREVGFTPPADPFRDPVAGEDWRFTLGCVALGAKITHLPERTWTYNCLPGNTSGLPRKW